MGFTFEANTRESPAIKISKLLIEEKADLCIYDPQAIHNAKLDLSEHSDIYYTECPYEAANDAEAILILTEWKFFRQLDYERIYKSMRKPAFIFDGRGLLDHQQLKDIGFHVTVIGKS